MSFPLTNNTGINSDSNTLFDSSMLMATSSEEKNYEEEPHTPPQPTAEQTLVAIANTTGYVHPMIARFYNSKNNNLETEANNTVLKPIINGTNHGNNDKYRHLFNLRDKIPAYEPRTYLEDLNGTSSVEQESLIAEFFGIFNNLYGTSSQLDGGSSTLSTDPENKNVPAPLQIVKEAHWFPKQSHSRIIYQTYTYGYVSGYHNVKIHVILKGDRDTYSRYFRVYIDSIKIYEKIVSPGPTYNLTISTSIYHEGEADPHLLTFEIYYGGYKEHGWMLTSLWLEDSVMPSGQESFVITGEYFPKQSYSKLSWKVLCGESTKMDITLRRVNDDFSRFFKVYLDGQLVFSDTVYGAHEYHLNLGDFQDNSIHTITLQINYGGYTEQGWILELFRIHHEGYYYEVDYMEGLDPRQDALNYIEEYYINHGYHRIEFYVDDEIPFDSETSWSVDYYSGELENCEYKDIEVHYYTLEHNIDPKWKYIVYGNQLEDEPGALGATNILGGEYVFIARGKCDNWADQNFISRINAERAVVIHEIGHTVHIGDWNHSTGDEIYCFNAKCVMAMASEHNCITYPFYCAHHWHQREFIYE